MFEQELRPSILHSDLPILERICIWEIAQGRGHETATRSLKWWLVLGIPQQVSDSQVAFPVPHTKCR